MKAKIEIKEGVCSLVITKENNSPILLLEWAAFTKTAILKVRDTVDGILYVKIDSTRVEYQDACEYINSNL